MSKLIELAERVEALEQESQPAWMNLEDEIANALGIRTSDFLTSIDAAMTLVPKGGENNHTWAAGDCHENEFDSWACVTGPPPKFRDYRAHAATPALALVAAALRAQAGEK